MINILLLVWGETNNLNHKKILFLLYCYDVSIGLNVIYLNLMLKSLPYKTIINKKTILTTPIKIKLSLMMPLPLESVITTVLYKHIDFFFICSKLLELRKLCLIKKYLYQEVSFHRELFW